ncbi:MAG: hypothetical protein PHO89_11785, partial [Methylacidiphilaceae bacterium]|nr:hypothetical protein [Candidatus Methylacidiphilaceae bacterium]
MVDSEGLGPKERAELARKLDTWKAGGLKVERLAPLLDGEAEEAYRAFETAERGIERLKGLTIELKELENSDNFPQVEKIRVMLRDPWLAQEAENAIVELQVQNEKRKKELQRRQKDEERRIREVAAKLTAFKTEGYEVSYLEEAVKLGADTAERELGRFQEFVARLRDSAEELKSLDSSAFPEERRRIEGMLKDPARIHDIEESLLQLRVKIERAKRDGALKQEQGKREREKLEERIRVLRSQGYSISEQSSAEGESAERLTRRLQEIERSAARLKELRDELEQIKDPELAAERDEARGHLRDLDKVQRAEESVVRLQLKAERLKREKAKRSEESEKRKSEARAKISEWKSKGYDTSRLESAIERDDEGLKRELVMYRIQLRRIQEVEAELRALPPEGIEDELARLLAKTKTVNIGVITELEDGLHSLRSGLEARKEAELSKKEDEKKEKQELVEKLSKWVTDGYRDGLVERVDKVMTQPITEIRDEFTKLERDIHRMNKLQQELESLDTTGFEAEARLIMAKIRDISKGEEVETRIRELREKVERKREDALRKAEEEKARRGEFQSKLAEWRDSGYNVASLERMLDGDMDVLRREMAIIRMRIQKAQELRAELDALETPDSKAVADDIRKDLKDLDRIPDNEERIENLRTSNAAREVQRKKLAEFRDKIAEYQAEGYETMRLERALSRDVDFIAKEFLVFKIKVAKLKELEDELRTLDRTGIENEALELEKDLKNPDKITEIRERLSALQ